MNPSFQEKCPKSFIAPTHQSIPNTQKPKMSSSSGLAPSAGQIWVRDSALWGFGEFGRYGLVSKVQGFGVYRTLNPINSRVCGSSIQIVRMQRDGIACQKPADVCT